MALLRLREKLGVEKTLLRDNFDGYEKYSELSILVDKFDVQLEGWCFNIAKLAVSSHGIADAASKMYGPNDQATDYYSGARAAKQSSQEISEKVASDFSSRVKRLVREPLERIKLKMQMFDKMIKERQDLFEEYDHYAKKLEKINADLEKLTLKGKVEKARDQEVRVRNEEKCAKAKSNYEEKHEALTKELNDYHKSRIQTFSPLFATFYELQSGYYETILASSNSFLQTPNSTSEEDQKDDYVIRGSLVLQRLDSERNPRISAESDDLASPQSKTNLLTVMNENPLENGGGSSAAAAYLEVATSATPESDSAIQEEQPSKVSGTGSVESPIFPEPVKSEPAQVQEEKEQEKQQEKQPENQQDKEQERAEEEPAEKQPEPTLRPASALPDSDPSDDESEDEFHDAES
mmetsp:Transcript_5660/g.10800  ORF Transcript_5660/g.10800 Transcript_5660/m.10800 type:complete len:407 (+) Transcript_5660:77-1297(+)